MAASGLACLAWFAACSVQPTFVGDAGGQTSGGAGGASSATSAAQTSSAMAQASSSTGGPTTTATSTGAATTSSAATTAGATGTTGTTGATTSSGTPCMPKTCADLGAQCGMIDDGCNDMISCGTCSSPGVCGAVTANQCCVPKTCADLGAVCGPASDGCGGTLECGACTGTEGCAAQGTANQCEIAIVATCSGNCPPGFNSYAGWSSSMCGGGVTCGVLTGELIPCIAPVSSLLATQFQISSTCAANQHLAGTWQDPCSSSGEVSLCITDP